MREQETMKVVREIREYIVSERGERPKVWVVLQWRWDAIAMEHEGGLGIMHIQIHGVPLVVV